MEPTQEKEHQKQQIKLKVIEPEVLGESESDVRPQTEGARPNSEAAAVSPVAKSLLNMPLEDFLATLDQSTPEQIEALLAKNKSVPLPAHIVHDTIKPFLSVPEGERSALNVVAWWESRRMVFNLVVGVCGLPTLMLMFLMHFPLGFLIGGTIAYALVANACYTLGWMAELVTRVCFAEKSRHMGPMLLTLGLVFSVTITLACAVIFPLMLLW